MRIRQAESTLTSPNSDLLRRLYQITTPFSTHHHRKKPTFLIFGDCAGESLCWATLGGHFRQFPLRQNRQDPVRVHLRRRYQGDAHGHCGAVRNTAASRRHILPVGMLRCYPKYDCCLSRQTGFTEILFSAIASRKVTFQ